MWDSLKEEYISKVVEEYAKPLVEDPRKNTQNNSSIDEDLPASFVICESRMNTIMAKNNNAANDDDNEDNEDEQKQLLKNLIADLRESQDDVFDLEDADHNYLSDEDEEEEFPEIELSPLQYASVRSQTLQIDDIDHYDDRNYWNTSHVLFDTDEILKTL